MGQQNVPAELKRRRKVPYHYEALGGVCFSWSAIRPGCVEKDLPHLPHAAV
jgi:hypothetical protein